jgi:hypothetical protein
MRMTNIIKAATWVAFLAGMSVAGIKYVAVVESDIDESSGASEQISRADVRLVTAELRREAVKNLPPKRYVIMTAETVMAQGGAVLEECADENCVITLGSKIGADYIVRGTVSKLESKFTLQVEMYETENGNLVASCDPVRSESIGELVERAAAVCANMYKAWLASQATEPEQIVEKRRKRYLGVNYALINSPAPKTEATPSLSHIAHQWFHIDYYHYGDFKSDWASNNLIFGMEYGLGYWAGYDNGTVYNKELETSMALDGSINAGYAYRLSAGFVVSLGVSIGVLFHFYAKDEDGMNNPILDFMEYNVIAFGGPLIRARWKFIEVSYRGVIGRVSGWMDRNGHEESWLADLEVTDTRWNWINQVRAGLYFEF